MGVVVVVVMVVMMVVVVVVMVVVMVVAGVLVGRRVGGRGVFARVGDARATEAAEARVAIGGYRVYSG